MKLKMILILTVASIALFSCRNKEINTEPKVIDLSSFGSVNMIKEIGGDIYVLNSTASSIHKLSGDSLSLFRDLEIGGRDFLLDFDIEGDKVYYSNTYDEIFISTGTTIEDTIKVFNPDRITVIDSLLYVTSRKSEDENVLLKVYDIKSKKEISCIPLNDIPVTEMKFSQVPICGYGNDLWVMNPFRNRLEKYNQELQIVSAIDMPEGYEYGNFFYNDNEFKILAVKGSKVVVINYSITKKEFYETGKEYNKADIDSRTSCVAKFGVYFYDYINSLIIINLTK